MLPRTLATILESNDRKIKEIEREIGMLKMKILDEGRELSIYRWRKSETETIIAFYCDFVERNNGRYLLCEKAYEDENDPCPLPRRNVFTFGKRTSSQNFTISITGDDFSLSHTILREA